MKLTARAVDNLDLLHTIATTPAGSIAGVAETLHRDPANTRKTVVALREEGFIEPDTLALTDAGATVTRIAGADGALLVTGDNVLRHPASLVPDPNNERRHITPEQIEEKLYSMLTRGQLQEIKIRANPDGGPDLVVIGETRWRGAMLGVERGIWPSDRPLRCHLITEADAKALTFMRMAENLHRDDLHRLDEGGGYIRLRDEFGMDAPRIAAELGGRRSAKHIADHIALVEKLGDDDKARMYLPEDDPGHLRYADARRLIQAQNARPKPAIDVDAREAMALLEVADRAAAQPSHDTLAPGASGWTRIPAMPAGGQAVRLVAKGLIEFREAEVGLHAWVRLAPGMLTEIRRWIAERDAMGMALWSARAEVAGAGVAAALSQSGRYANGWLNEPLPERPEPEPAALPPPSERQPAPPAATATPQAGQPAQSPPPPAEAGEVDRRASVETEGAQVADDDPFEPEIPDYLRRLAGADPEPRSAPASPSPPAPLAVLTDAQLRILLDVAAATAADPQPGRLDPVTGVPAFQGARAYKFFNDPVANKFVVEHRMLAFVPEARDRFQIAVITKAGRAWLEAAGHPVTATPPYATAWLNPPAPDSPPPSQTGEVDRRANVEPEGAQSAITYFAKPIIEPPREWTCGNCERDFEISAEIDCDESANSLRLDDDVVDSAIFTAPVAERRRQCPHCEQPVMLLAAEVYLCKRGDD